VACRGGEGEGETASNKAPQAAKVEVAARQLECTRLSAQSRYTRYTKLSTSGLDSLAGNDVRRGSMLSVLRFAYIIIIIFFFAKVVY
jgi:hypothetical protein